MIIPKYLIEPKGKIDHLNAQYNELGGKTYPLKYSSYHNDMTNQICNRFRLHSKLNMIQDLYNDSKEFFVYNYAVLSKILSKEKDPTFHL